MNDRDSDLAEMTQERWNDLTAPQREAMRDMSAVTRHQLAKRKGWRVEVVTTYGETRRFNVGQSTGWRPCLLEIRNRRSMGGMAVEDTYASVRPIRRVHA